MPPKETTATARQRDLLVEVKTNAFYGLRTIAKKVKKYRQVKNLVLHQQMKTPYILCEVRKGRKRGASPNGTNIGRRSGESNCSREKECEYGEQRYNRTLLL